MSIRTRYELEPLYAGLGRETHVGVSESDARLGVSVREFITAEAYRPEDQRMVAPKTNAQVGRKARSTYVGPDGKRGLSLMSPDQAFALADALVAAALECQRLSELEEVPA